MCREEWTKERTPAALGFGVGVKEEEEEGAEERRRPCWIKLSRPEEAMNPPVGRLLEGEGGQA